MGSMELTHVDESGKVRMVDVGEKQETEREAVAKGRIYVQPETLRLIMEDGIKKGNVFACARVAGIMAAKNTSGLIPMCHNIPLNSVKVDLTANTEKSCVDIETSVKCTYKTGVEMEALTALSVAALTVYDMCKAVDKSMKISECRLIKKTGGKSDMGV